MNPDHSLDSDERVRRLQGMPDVGATCENQKLPGYGDVDDDQCGEHAAEGNPGDPRERAVYASGARRTSDPDQQQIQCEHAGTCTEGAEPGEAGEFWGHALTLAFTAAAGKCSLREASAGP